MKRKQLTIVEAMGMEGTEFDYEFEDGDTIRAYIKKFSPLVGCTCFTLEPETKSGWEPSDEDTTFEQDGTYCIYGAEVGRDGLQKILEDMYEMKKGFYSMKSEDIVDMSIGSVNCAFI